ncbi:hypothetical protein D3C86_2023920 [compost metagenome]
MIRFAIGPLYKTSFPFSSLISRYLLIRGSKGVCHLQKDFSVDWSLCTVNFKVAFSPVFIISFIPRTR